MCCVASTIDNERNPKCTKSDEPPQEIPHQAKNRSTRQECKETGSCGDSSPRVDLLAERALRHSCWSSCDKDELGSVLPHPINFNVLLLLIFDNSSSDGQITLFHVNVGRCPRSGRVNGCFLRLVKQAHLYSTGLKQSLRLSHDKGDSRCQSRFERFQFRKKRTKAFCFKYCASPMPFPT